MATADFSHEMPLAPGASEGASLRRTLDRLAARHNRLRFWNEIARAMCWGVGFAALGVLAYKFYLLDGDWWMVALPIALSALIGYRNGVMKRSGAFDAALDADQTLDLNDRLASALAFTHPELIRQRRANAPETRFFPRLRAILLPRPAYATATPTLQTALVPALVQDAALRAGTLDPKAVYPLRFGRPQKFLAGASVALTGFVFMPSMPYLLSQEQKSDAKKTLPETGKKLQAIAKEVQDNKDLKDPKTKNLSKKLMALGKRMERARMGKKEALVEMAQLREKVAQAAKQSPPEFKAQLDPAPEELRHQQMKTDEGRKMQQHLDKGEMEQAAKQLEKLAEKIEKGNLSNEEKEKAAHDLEKAAQALRKQGGAQNEQMAQKLEQAAKALREESKQQGQKGQQGEDGKKQNGKQQDGQKGQEKQGQNGQQQGQQGKKPGEQQKAGQNGQQQGDKQGQQQKAGQNGQQQGQKQGQQQGNQQSGQQPGQRKGSQSGSQQAQQGGSEALRKMAESMRGGGSGQGQGNSNSPSLQRMLDQIKEAERQAGSGGSPGNNPGMNGQSGDCPGGDCNGVTPGKDLKPSDPNSAVGGGPGLGRRDHIKGFNNKGGGLSNQHAKRTGDKRRWEDVWASRLPSTQKRISRIKGNLGQGEVEQLQTEGDPKGGPVKTPYYDVYDTYKKEADDAVGKEVVPPAYKQPVKDYFDSIKPSK